MPNASDLFEMLGRACTFPVGIPARKIDPEVTRRFDCGKNGGSQDLVCALRDLLDRRSRPWRE